jgi:hypothetical protein
MGATDMEDGQKRSLMPSATLMRWRKMLATFAETHEPLIKNVPALRVRLLDRIPSKDASAHDIRADLGRGRSIRAVSDQSQKDESTHLC